MWLFLDLIGWFSNKKNENFVKIIELVKMCIVVLDKVFEYYLNIISINKGFLCFLGVNK